MTASVKDAVNLADIRQGLQVYCQQGEVHELRAIGRRCKIRPRRNEDRKERRDSFRSRFTFLRDLSVFVVRLRRTPGNNIPIITRSVSEDTGYRCSPGFLADASGY